MITFLAYGCHGGGSMNTAISAAAIFLRWWLDQMFKGVTDASATLLKIDFQSVNPPPIFDSASASVQDVNRQTWGANLSGFIIGPVCRHQDTANVRAERRDDRDRLDRHRPRRKLVAGVM